MTTPGLSLRVVAALAADALPAYRPRSGVVHLYLGRPTASGRYASVQGVTVCRSRTGRLHLQPGWNGLDLRGRRWCRSCTRLLPTALGTDVCRLVSREDLDRAYGHLSLPALETAAMWTTSVDDTHRVARVASVVLGPPQMYGARDAYAQRIYDLDQKLNARRRTLRVVEMTPEEREAAARVREDEADDRRRTRVARRKSIARERAIERRRRGVYMTPRDKALADSA